jgi:HAD superfamily hydrolase (TIGR01509 family)
MHLSVPPRPTLAIFDCDGVLVDSEPIANRIFAEGLQELGLTLDLEEMYELFVGRTMGACMQKVEELLGRPAPADFLARVQARTFAAFEAAPVQAIPDVAEALDAVVALGLRVCVASSGEVEKMQLTLGLAGLLPRFAGHLYSATQVARSKPAPDIYLHAANQMGVAPSECVVIEDSPAGATAGVGAGMTVLGFAAHTPAEKLRSVGVAHTFTRMHELPELLRGQILRANYSR